VGLDSVVGIVHERDALLQALEGGLGDLRAVAREAVFVPDTMALSDFLRELQEKQAACAIVLDERGTAIGLAFREDALEEIVGPLGDEFDEHEHRFRELGNGAYDVSGRMSLPELCSRLDLDLSEDEDEAEDTIGGHVTARLGRLPEKGDKTDVGPYEATVLDATGRRVRRLRLKLRAVAIQEEEHSGASGPGSDPA
jgi:putative hemolysin